MRISLLEDDSDHAEIAIHWLESAGHSVTHFFTAQSFLRQTLRESFDLHILDWVLGEDKSGFGVLTEIRNQREDSAPIIFVTAKDREDAIASALNAGADDYLIKPIRETELVARVNAVARRAGIITPSRGSLSYDPYTFDLERHELRLDGAPVALTQREYQLALFLFQRTGMLVSREHVLEAIWGMDQAKVHTRTVDTHIYRLRKKLGFSKESGWTLTSVYQHGYRLESPRELATGAIV